MGTTYPVSPGIIYREGITIGLWKGYRLLDNLVGNRVRSAIGHDNTQRIFKIPRGFLWQIIGTQHQVNFVR